MRLGQGPVAIVGADGQVGTAVRTQLAERPNETRAVGRHSDLAHAFAGASAVVHLAGACGPSGPTPTRLRTLTLSGPRWPPWRVRSPARGIPVLSGRRYVVDKPVPAIQGGSGRAHPRLRRPCSDLPGCAHRGVSAVPGPTAQAMLSSRDRPVTVLGSGSSAMAGLRERMSLRFSFALLLTTRHRLARSSWLDRIP